MLRLAALALVSLVTSTAVSAGELSGTATYRERIALPQEAKFQAILYDISNNDQVEIGRFEAAGNAGPPYAFNIEYSDGAVVDEGRYAIKVQVLWPKRPYVAAGAILEGYPRVVPNTDLIMVRPGVEPTQGGDGPANSTLENTYWRLDEIDGAPIPKRAAEREAHLIIEAGAENAYRATLGCNRMSGAYSLEGGVLEFSPSASTMMACPDPIDKLERDFGLMMSEVTGFDIKDETLLLHDASGTIRAMFTAVYF